MNVNNLKTGTRRIEVPRQKAYVQRKASAAGQLSISVHVTKSETTAGNKASTLILQLLQIILHLLTQPESVTVLPFECLFKIV